MRAAFRVSPAVDARRRAALRGLLAMPLLLAGCAIIDKPVRANLYDFGPAASAAPAPAGALPAPVVLLPEVDAGPALDNAAVLYRLAYADAQQLQPYAQARWTMAPAALLHQRLRERLAQQVPVLTPGDAAAAGLPSALLLQVELEEFSQVFSAPESSQGLVRLRATAVRSTRGAEQLLGQRGFSVQRPAPGADARGGVRALTQATDAALEELVSWLTTLR